MPIRIMPGEVTPTLFIGLGGSGGKAVGRIAKRLQAHPDFEHQYRSLIRFVAIDTNDADLARLRKGTADYGRIIGASSLPFSPGSAIPQSGDQKIHLNLSAKF